MDINKVDELNEVLEERGEEFRASAHIVVKPHGVLKGICLKTDGCNVSPTIYLEGHENDTIEEYADFCTKVMHAEENQREDIQMNIDKWTDKEYILANVLPRLTHQDNLDRLNRNNTYYIRFLDLVIFFYFPVCMTENGYQGTITISNDLIKAKKINAPDLYETALKNLEPQIDIKTMYEIISEMVPAFEDDPIDDGMMPRMYVATNTSKINGAAVILTQKFKDKISEIFGDKAVILPSSRHEVIITDYQDNMATETAKMIQEVNRSEVSAEDILSDHPYYFVDGNIYSNDIAATH